MKEKNYKLLKKLILVLFTTVAVATVLTACNGDNGQTSESGDQKPPIGQTEVSVSQILADIQEYNEFDHANSFNGVAAEVVKNNIEDSEATFLNYTVADHNFVVVAENKNGSFTSVALPISEECENYVKNITSKQTLVLNVAGLSASDMIKENEKDATVKKITDAIEKIESNVAKIADAEPSQTNNYIAEGDKIDLDGLFAEDRSAAYLREDGSVIAFVFDEEKCEITMKHYVVDGAKDMAAAQIVSAIKNGVSCATSTQLKFNEDLQIPPLDIQVEMVTFEEIANQVFGENYSLPGFDELMNELLPKIVVGERIKLLFTGFEGDNFYIYIEIIATGGIQGFGKSEYIGNKLEDIIKYRTEVGSVFDSKNFLSTLKESFAAAGSVEVGSSEETSLRLQILEYKSQIEKACETIKASQKADFMNSTLQVVTNTVSNDEDYAQKLFPGKEIVAAYVGDLGGGSIDSSHFGTGYYDAFKIATAYIDEDNIKVAVTEIYVPWYTNSTTESLYRSFLDNVRYEIVKEETTVVSNPIIVKNKEA